MTAMTEDDMQLGIEGALTAGGWWFHHDVPSTRLGFIATHHRGASGWPDIVAIHPERRRLIVLELKSEKGRTTPLQDIWLEAFTQAGVDARIVRPEDYDALIDELVGDRMLSRRKSA